MLDEKKMNKSDTTNTQRYPVDADAWLQRVDEFAVKNGLGLFTADKLLREFDRVIETRIEEERQREAEVQTILELLREKLLFEERPNLFVSWDDEEGENPVPPGFAKLVGVETDETGCDFLILEWGPEKPPREEGCNSLVGEGGLDKLPDVDELLKQMRRKLKGGQ